MIEVDARGLSCPIPIVRIRAAIAEHPGTEISVLLDDVEQQENVARMAEHAGYRIEQADGLNIRLVPVD